MSKPQDGVVSRYLNRRLSRLVTRYLLNFPIHPNAWTMSIFVLPILSGAFVLRGDYASVLIGALILQIYSILDGCDGEIARAKGLESKFGEWLDHFCDLVGSLFFVLCLGIGIEEPLEGTLCVLLIGINEFLLRLGHSRAPGGPLGISDSFYSRHRGMIQHSGVLHLGERFVSAIFQATKRDVAILVFFLLALIGQPKWILHLWTTVALLSLVLSGIAVVRARDRRRSVIAPDPRP